jgi:hypothetical protein
VRCRLVERCWADSLGGAAYSVKAAAPRHSKGLDVELTAVQMQLLERLFATGFRPIAIPPYENALCVHRGECAAVLAPVENGGLRLLSPVTVLVDGNLSVKLKKVGGDVFVWKKKEVAATVERLKMLEQFRAELMEILEVGGKQ